MKTRKVRENRQRRVAAFRLVHKPPHCPPQRGQELQYFGDTYNGNFRVVGNDLNASSAHLRSAHPENHHVHTLLQSCCETRGVHVSGSFAGREEERDWWHL